MYMLIHLQNMGTITVDCLLNISARISNSACPGLQGDHNNLMDDRPLDWTTCPVIDMLDIQEPKSEESPLLLWAPQSRT